MAARALRLLGNPLLRRVSQPVASAHLKNATPYFQDLLREMEAQVRQEDGVGIAAPQLGENLRVFLMLKNAPTNEHDLESDVDSHPHAEFQAIVNPTILRLSDATFKDFEGCLSVPGYVGAVARAREVLVQFLDRDGQQHVERFRDFPARIFQHEFDHLDGIVYTDRIEKGTLVHVDEFHKMDVDTILKLLGMEQPSST